MPPERPKTPRQHPRARVRYSRGEEKATRPIAEQLRKKETIEKRAAAIAKKAIGVGFRFSFRGYDYIVGKITEENLLKCQRYNIADKSARFTFDPRDVGETSK